MRVLEHGESVGSIARDWIARGIKPVAAKQWWPTSIVGTLTSARLGGLAGVAGYEVPDHAMADDHRPGHLRAPGQAIRGPGPAGCTRCAARRTCCPGSRGAPNAAGACITATSARPVAATAAAPSRMRASKAPGRVRRSGDQGGPAGGIRDRRGAGRAGIPARAAGTTRRRGPARASRGNCWNRSGPPRNGAMRRAATTPAGSSTGPTGWGVAQDRGEHHDRCRVFDPLWEPLPCPEGPRVLGVGLLHGRGPRRSSPQRAAGDPWRVAASASHCRW